MMKQIDDPRFEFIKAQNPNASLKELKRLYYLERWIEKRNNPEYLNWKKTIDREFKRLNIQKNERGVVQGKIYKAIEDQLEIDLGKITAEQENVSKMQTVFKNEEIRNCFDSILNHIGTDLINESEYKIYNVYFALNFWAKDGCYVKIGVSKNHPEIRIKDLNRYNSDKWQLLGYIAESEKTLEKDLHEKFKKYNIEKNGEREWFVLNSEILNYARENCTYFNEKLAPVLVGM
jgi:hypothetical protein